MKKEFPSLCVLGLALVFQIPAFSAMAPKLTVGNQTFSAATGAMNFTNCCATASYVAGSGFTLHFWGDSVLNYPNRMTVIETTQSAPLTIVLDTGIDVIVRAKYCGVSCPGDLTIKGAGTFEVLTTSGSLLETDDAIHCSGDFTAILGVTVNVGKQGDTIRFSEGKGIYAGGELKFEVAFGNIAGKADSLLYGRKGVKIMASMLNLWQDWGEGKAYANPAVKAVGGGVTIQGSVLSLLSQGDAVFADNGGEVFIAQSCAVVVSYGHCFSAFPRISFSECNVTAVSGVGSAISIAGAKDRPYGYYYDDSGNGGGSTHRLSFIWERDGIILVREMLRLRFWEVGVRLWKMQM